MRKEVQTKSMLIVVRYVLNVGIFLLLSYLLLQQYGRWICEAEKFKIREIDIDGNEIVSKKEILKLSGIEKNGSIWNVCLDSVYTRLMKNPFIENVDVHKRLPDRIELRVIEKAPIALLNFQGKFYSIDSEGLVLPSRPGKLYDLPVISGGFKGGVSTGSRAGGKQVSNGLYFLTRVLREVPQLYDEISEVYVGDPEGLIVYTNSSVVPVIMGKDEFGWKIRCLDAIIKRLRSEGNLSNIDYIDIRFKGQVIVGMKA